MKIKRLISIIVLIVSVVAIIAYCEYKKRSYLDKGIILTKDDISAEEKLDKLRIDSIGEILNNYEGITGRKISIDTISENNEKLAIIELEFKKEPLEDEVLSLKCGISNLTTHYKLFINGIER